jgi:class 3 adenylate cyclase
LFADVAGYSKLPEELITIFVNGYFGQIAYYLRNCNPSDLPLYKNTWGDGILMIFDQPAQAAAAALGIQNSLAEMDLKSLGLPESMGLRIAIHSGPVFRITDPILERENFMGTHISLAARLEPVTQMGRVFITEPFVAALTATAPGQFNFTYVGNIMYAKDYGYLPTYWLLGKK